MFFPFPLYPEVRVPLPLPGRIWKQVEAFQPDLIHIATEATLGLAMIRKASKSPFPVVSSYHTNFSQYIRHYYAGFLEERVWQYLRWFHNQTLRTYCPSRMTQEQLQSKGFKNVEIWSRGIEPELFSPKQYNPELRDRLGIQRNEILAVYVGRLAKEKNLPQLLRVFNRLKQSVPAVRLLLVGDGPIRRQIEREAPPGVICVGYKKGVELTEHFAIGDLFLFPSLTETFGNVVIEALSSGLPVVGFRAGGVPHSVHHGENGLLADPDNEDEFLSLAEQVCSNPELREQMAIEARAYALTQTWDHIFQQLFNSYKEVLCSATAGANGQTS